MSLNVFYTKSFQVWLVIKDNIWASERGKAQNFILCCKERNLGWKPWRERSIDRSIDGQLLHLPLNVQNENCSIDTKGQDFKCWLFAKRCCCCYRSIILLSQIYLSIYLSIYSQNAAAAIVQSLFYLIFYFIVQNWQLPASYWPTYIHLPIFDLPILTYLHWPTYIDLPIFDLPILTYLYWPTYFRITIELTANNLTMTGFEPRISGTVTALRTDCAPTTALVSNLSPEILSQTFLDPCQRCP